MSLSDKKRWGELSSFCIEKAYYYPAKDVKEFIKNLKNIDFEGFYPEHIIEVIDELAGEELSNG